MSWCRAVSCVFGNWCLLQPVHSLDTTLLAFALLHFAIQGRTCCHSRYILTSFFCFPSPIMKKTFIYFFLLLVLEGLVGLHITVQLQLLQHQQLGHRLGWLWCWMVCLGNEPRSWCCSWGCTQVLHFGPFCWLCELPHFFYRIFGHISRYNGHLN